jgi:hypothetical protein
MLKLRYPSGRGRTQTRWRQQRFSETPGRVGCMGLEPDDGKKGTAVRLLIRGRNGNAHAPFEERLEIHGEFFRDIG